MNVNHDSLRVLAELFNHLRHLTLHPPQSHSSGRETADTVESASFSASRASTEIVNRNKEESHQIFRQDFSEKTSFQILSCKIFLLWDFISIAIPEWFAPVVDSLSAVSLHCPCSSHVKKEGNNMMVGIGAR
jgi:hypothetical protein